MDWYVMRLPETGGVGVVAETALEHHRLQGWLRVSNALKDGDKNHVVLADFGEAPDLDAQPERPASKTSTKEK